jgi:hypothetical protein
VPCCETILVTVEPQSQLNVITVGQQSQLNILTVGQQGPQGVAGVSGTAVIPNALAGGNLSGHRLVYFDNSGVLQLASSNNLSHMGRVVGMTTSASVSGSPAEVFTMGLFTEPSWFFDTSIPIYLGNDGLITQVVPSQPNSLFSQIVGYVINPTTIYLHLETPIIIN